MARPRSPATDPVERLFSRTEKDGECIVWLGDKDKRGYGRFKMNGKDWGAHRASYHLMIGPIPEGLTIDHLCRNICCINPEHLEPVTDAENQRRAYEARKHCNRGHLYTTESVYLHKGRTRHCIHCRTLNYYRRKAA